ncbi:MAG TPA: preprotein translocase subunit SecY, partial [Spirochaetota bacterium]|nr:preprotein translocase subunit SecY [Spirochaetota bacterium]
MANMISNIFKVPDLRKRVMFTVMALIVFRIGCHITAPGIDPLGMQDLMRELSSQSFGGLMEYFNMFVGGAFKKFTIFALGIMPYISASIIINLLQTVVPHLERLRKEGEQGRKKIQQYTRIGTVLICIIQATSISIWISNQGDVIASS